MKTRGNLDYFTGLCDEGDWETGVKTDVLTTKNDDMKHHKEVKIEQFSTLI